MWVNIPVPWILWVEEFPFVCPIDAEPTPYLRKLQIQWAISSYSSVSESIFKKEYYWKSIFLQGWDSFMRIHHENTICKFYLSPNYFILFCNDPDHLWEPSGKGPSKMMEFVPLNGIILKRKIVFQLRGQWLYPMVKVHGTIPKKVGYYRAYI